MSTQAAEVTQEEEVVEDRRAAIEAAFEATETPEGEVVKEEKAPVTEVVAEESKTAPEAKPVEAKTTPETVPPTTEGEPAVNADKAPQSWKPAQKAKWATLDPDVRQEVMRRERDISRTLGETAQARQVANQFNQVVQPYMARIQSYGVHPMQAVEELLKADYVLATAPQGQRAQAMAKLIKDYGVDIQALDSALAGTVQTDPVQSTVERLVEQRLAPMQQFFAQQQAAQAQAAQAYAQETQMTIEKMASDPKYPHFEDVRVDMADVIDLAAKRGKTLTLEEAYTRAVALNPEISQLQAQQQAAEAKKAAAQTANARAQRALNASKSVGGAPVGAVTGGATGNSRRAALEAAFDEAGGR